MKKLLNLISGLVLITGSTTSVVACSSNQNTPIINQAPNWVKTMVKQSKEKKASISVGYQNYFLKPWLDNQEVYINIDKNPNIYIYLKDANNISQAAQEINMEDTATPWNVPVSNNDKDGSLSEQIFWNKNNNNTYTNNAYITEDTTVSGYALMDETKYQDITTSSLAKAAWTNDERTSFNTYGTMPTSITPSGKLNNQSWWNSNGWDRLLTNQKYLIPQVPKGSENKNKYSQKFLYDRWINQSAIGMNVPLSLMNSGDFTLSQTNVAHVYLLNIKLQEAWINNKGDVETINCPHWGVEFNIKDPISSETYSSPQIVNLHNIANYSIKTSGNQTTKVSIINYLKTETSPVSWASLNYQTSKFSNWKIS